VRAFDESCKDTWLFFFAHPDDELAICAWISRLVSTGNRVHMCWVHSTPVREKEARCSASLLKVPQSQLHFLSGKDGHIVEQMSTLAEEFRQIIRVVKPDRVCTCAFEQGHLDHDATNFLAANTFAGPILEYPLYHTYLTTYKRVNRFASQDTGEVLRLCAGERALKHKISNCYPSQPLKLKLTAYELINLARLSPQRLALTERLRFQTHFEFLQPNLPEPLSRKVVESDKWRRWRSGVEAFEPQSKVFAVAAIDTEVARHSSMM
jgi:LmbE family N-acetylglucosaminyl deacetylase